MPTNYTKASRKLGSGSYTPHEIDALLARARPKTDPGVTAVEMSSGPGLLLRRRGGEAAFVHAGLVKVNLGSKRTIFEAEIAIAVVTEPRPHVAVEQLTIRPVPGGPAITARAVQGANVGSAIRSAVRALTMSDEPEQWVNAATARGASEPRPRVDPGELEEVARLYREAQAAGRPTREHVRAGLAKYVRHDVSTGAAGNRIRQARHATLLPLARSTRPKEG